MAASKEETPAAPTNDVLPTCILVLGMAGSGKTTFVQKLAEVSKPHYNPFVINLDPACLDPPYFANIDIRRSVNHKDVMKNYKLGPNGAIVTSLNLFTMKFESVIELIKKAGEEGHKWVIIDTPGQIEVFTWSASGEIISKALASAFPTVVTYVVDTERSAKPTTFMSNMMYACSILYKMDLPFLLALNKVDVIDASFINDWMSDSLEFEEALRSDESYMSNLTRSMSLTLEAFYTNIKSCSVSSMTGAGFGNYFDRIAECKQEYLEEYKKEIETRRIEISKAMEQQADMAVDLATVKLTLNIDEEPKKDEGFSLRLADSDNDDDDNELDIKETAEEKFFENFVGQHKDAEKKKAEKQPENQQ